MITLIVKVDVKSGMMADFIKETQIAQHKAIKEDGCLIYVIGKGYEASKINEITLVEMYADEEAIDFHKTTPHFLEWRDKVQPFMNSPRQVEKLVEILTKI